MQKYKSKLTEVYVQQIMFPDGVQAGDTFEVFGVSHVVSWDCDGWPQIWVKSPIGVMQSAGEYDFVVRHFDRFLVFDDGLFNLLFEEAEDEA